MLFSGIRNDIQPVKNTATTISQDFLRDNRLTEANVEHNLNLTGTIRMLCKLQGEFCKNEANKTSYTVQQWNKAH